jgi:hypothetical protein
MKHRNGFVSNSSSSSFVIGIGKIRPDALEDFTEWIESIPPSELSRYDFRFLSTSDILERDLKNEIVEVSEGVLSVTAEVNTEPKVSIPFDPNEDAKYFFVRIGNDEGDYEFMQDRNECRFGYCYDHPNYDQVNDDWFGGVQRKIIDVLRSGKFFDKSVCEVGAERNG